ncbi:MAG: HD domain-containing phosphohydrolase, partial [Phycisphaerae bacterium]
MQILEVNHLQPGQSFPHPLFHRSGRKLLGAQTLVTAQHIEALRRTGVGELYLAPNAQEVLEFANSKTELVPTNQMRLGQLAATDLMTPDGVVMIQQNELIEEHHLTALRDSQTHFLIPRGTADTEAVRALLADLTSIVRRRTEATIRRGEYLRAPESRDPLKDSLPIVTSQETLNRNAVQLLRGRLSSRLQPVYGMLETGKNPGMDALDGVTNDLLDLMRSESRQFSQLALMTQRRSDYLPDHAISVAVLAMAIATQMGLSLAHVKEVILGALMFDVGMLMVPKRIRVSTGALCETDRLGVREHPLLSLCMMEQMTALSPIPRIIAYQHHERSNGSGYPSCSKGNQISDFAQIIAVADIFAAATNPRSYKSSKLPYTAMEELILMAHRGLLDVQPIKALLAAIGLFPVGSHVL